MEMFRRLRSQLSGNLARSIFPKARISWSAPLSSELRACILVTGLIPAINDAGVAVGRVAGDFGVSATGGAIYSVPIAVPAGRNGLKPNIALTYNSQRSSGVAGVGWDLSGFSSVRRCDHIFALDDEARGVRFDSDDRFCLDGRPLLLKSGIYGRSGATYRPEIHDYELVTSNSSIGLHSPASFIVQTRNGLTYHYGTDADSRIMAGSTGEVYVWALNAIEDTVGNRIEFVYTSPGPDLEFVPTEVLWTSGNGVAPRYRLLLEYEDRANGGTDKADVRRGYLYGVAWQRTQRLDKIRYQYGTTGAYSDVHVYTLGYTSQADNGTATGRSQLQSITQCEKLSIGEDCFPATTVTYEPPGSDGWSVYSGVWPTVADFDGAIFGDFNGDDRTDIYWPNSSDGKWSLLQIDSFGYIHPPESTSEEHNGNGGFPLDYNGDGRTDLLTVRNSTWQVLQADADFPSPSFTLRDTNIAASEVTEPIVLDIDGDGLDDIAALCETEEETVCYWINNGDQVVGNSAFPLKETYPLPEMTGGCVNNTTYQVYSVPGPQRQADFDGDGREDLLIYSYVQCVGYHSFWRAFLSTGNGFEQMVQPITGINANLVVTDVNGDGLSDLIGPASDSPTTSVIFHISDGESLSGAYTTSISVSGDSQIKAVDYQNDGLMDLLIPSPTPGEWRVHLSEGGSYNQTTYVEIDDLIDPANVGVLVVAEIDGDDTTDILLGDISDSKWKHRRADHHRRDLLDKVTDGLGNWFEPTYVRMNQTAYTAPSGASAPTLRAAPNGPYVTSNYKSNDGIGGDFTISHSYTGGLRDVTGRGFLGFETVTVTDSRDNLRQITDYEQPFPLTGRPAMSRVRQPVGNDDDIRTTDPSWTDYTGEATATTEIGTFHYVHLETSTEQHFELDGTKIREVAQDLAPTDYAYDYDTHGAPTAVEVITTSDASPWSSDTWTSLTTYGYDSGIAGSAHCLGFPTGVTVERTTDTSVTESRIRNRTYNGSCQVLTEVIGGSLAPTTERLKTIYAYTGGGLLDWVVLDAEDGTSTADRTTELTWDSWGYRVTQSAIELNSEPSLTVQTGWNYELGLQSSQTDPRGHQTAWQYDGFGRLDYQTNPNSADVDIAYSNCSGCFANHAEYKLRTEMVSGGGWAESYHDKYGRVVGRASILVDGDANQQQLAYNARGLLVTEQVPYISGGAVYAHSYTHDLVGRVLTVTRPVTPLDNAVTTYTYTPLVVSVEEEFELSQTRTTTQQFDPLGQLREIDPPDTAAMVVGATHYEYHPFGELASVSEPGAPANIVKAWTYDGLGQPDIYTDANSGTWDYNYSVFGQLVRQEDDMATPNVIVWGYDQAGRIKTRTEPSLGLLNSTSTNWTYHQSGNGFGLLASVNGPTTSSTYSESYVYGIDGRVATRTKNIETHVYVTDYTYDPVTGQVEDLTYPASLNGVRHTINYQYSNGILDRVQWDDGTTVTDLYDVVDADPVGRPSDVNWGDFTNPALETLYHYDHASLRLTGIQTGTGGSSYLEQDYLYTWNKAGDLKSRKDVNQSNLTETFNYDELSRLTDVDLNSSNTLSLTYYDNGNIKTKSDVGIYVYGQNGAGPHAVTEITSPAPDLNHYTTFHYDANGNMDCRGDTTTACTNGRAITWYSFNKPHRIWGAGGVHTTLVYDADRSLLQQRKWSTSGVFDINHVGQIYEHETEDAPNAINRWRSFVYAGNKLIYVIKESHIAGCSPTTDQQSYFVFQDHLGSTDTVAHDVNPVSSINYSYDAFGLRRIATGWADDSSYSQLDTQEVINRGFTDHEHQDHVRAIYMRGRTYDPIIGRMISVDPVIGDGGSQTHNGYSFVGNGPLSSVDPTGFERVKLSDCWRNICIDTSGQADVIEEIVSTATRIKKKPPPDPQELARAQRIRDMAEAMSYRGRPSPSAANGGSRNESETVEEIVVTASKDQDDGDDRDSKNGFGTSGGVWILLISHNSKVQARFASIAAGPVLTALEVAGVISIPEEFEEYRDEIGSAQFVSGIYTIWAGATISVAVVPGVTGLVVGAGVFTLTRGVDNMTDNRLTRMGSSAFCAVFGGC